MAESSTSINIPQIIAVALVSFLAIRWFLNKPQTPSTNSTSTSASSRNQTVDIAKIDQVSAMFPQLDRRNIAWDLHRNGGNVAATTERILGGRGLDAAPPSFQPPNLTSNINTTTTAASSAGSKAGASGQQDLITRYGLQGRVGGKGKEAVMSEEQKRNAWSADKGQRAEGLKRRREEMILEARRRMEAKDGGQ